KRAANATPPPGSPPEDGRRGIQRGRITFGEYDRRGLLDVLHGTCRLLPWLREAIRRALRHRSAECRTGGAPRAVVAVCTERIQLEPVAEDRQPASDHQNRGSRREGPLHCKQ